MSMTIDNQTGGILTRFVGNALEGVAGAARHLRSRIAINHNRRTLHALPDHILKDIGLARGDIDYVTDQMEAGMDRRWDVMERRHKPNRGRGL